MIDERFYQSKGPVSLGELKKNFKLSSAGVPDDWVVKGAATLDAAGPNDISFLHNALYVDGARKSRAGAILTTQDFAKSLGDKPILMTDQPLALFSRLLMTLYAVRQVNDDWDVRNGAHVARTAKVAEGVILQPGACIGPGAIIGSGSVVGSQVSIGPNVIVGKDCQIDSHAFLAFCILGNGVHVKPGARIGQSGFGFAFDPENPLKRIPQPQLGRVLIGDDVEIGANTTIDRGSLRDTVIGNSVRIDNLVQVAHNVEVGDGAIIVAQVGISGSARLGKGVILGGQVGVAGHVSVGDHVQVAAKSGLARSVEAGRKVAGYPAVDKMAWHRQNLFLSKKVKPGN